ncbi:MAG: hypothetical protein LC685_02760, partial [Actinobacteria bacterium]|nr:hypothetical protein [Actinomycetota bacterium]
MSDQTPSAGPVPGEPPSGRPAVPGNGAIPGTTSRSGDPGPTDPADTPWGDAIVVAGGVLDGPETPSQRRIPEATVARLPVY